MWPTLTVLSLLTFGWTIFFSRDNIAVASVIPFIVNGILLFRMLKGAKVGQRQIDYGPKSLYELWSRHLIGWLLLSAAYLLGVGGR